MNTVDVPAHMSDKKIIHKVAAMVFEDDAFLMVLKKGKDVWTNLGGKPEAGETELDALRREIRLPGRHQHVVQRARRAAGLLARARLPLLHAHQHGLPGARSVSAGEKGAETARQRHQLATGV